MFDLSGRGALVTGASGGIGGAIARALHERGAKLALSGTRVGPLEALADELGGAEVLPCDLADPEATAALGPLIAITSIVGTTGNPGQANYAASKAGLAGMTKALAQEVASRGITANCVAPGFIETAMTDALGEDQRGKLLAGVPAGRLGRPEEVAACVAFLASEEAGYVTGQTLHVNGGMAMI